MANARQRALIDQGAAAWNQWRAENPEERPDLSNEDLSGLVLPRINLSGANLAGARLMRTDLSEADLHFADLTCANLMDASLDGANLDGAMLFCANFAMARLTGALIRRAILIGAVLVEADLTGAHLSESQVYGVSAWNARLDGAAQYGLIVTAPNEPQVTVDHLEMAQFVDLVLRNENVRSALDTLTSKIVLILGRFSPERKAVLDALRSALRDRNYAPVLFDFENQQQRSLTETVTAIANMAGFVIADITDARSVPQELAFIVPHLPTLPVQLIAQESDNLYPLYEIMLEYKRVRGPFRYRDPDHLLTSLEKLIEEAESLKRRPRPDTRTS